ncbi:MAG TPA: lytic murein transglycosylase [Paracoccus solventivorans]|mgnify:CR=1 FL=1|uniref:Lytic murein transglycosylase n=1 Tax=Paracoccus solventivorans TaxID=53463 RepID=A0A832PLG0_9RHOB|nr:lytic murein transglycosylase [Paracoccus solventivorans]HHW33101.1 lytic murein transglycosylase [Paracoccus solventivorans]HMM09050.1 lytic murein transglycosylase [Paracoccus solventivorans]
MRSSIGRLALSAAAVTILGSCGMGIGMGPGLGAIGAGTGSSVTPAPIPAADAGTEASFQRWVQDFRPRAISSGVSAATYDRSMRIARYNPEVIRLDRRQSEFARPIWLYLDSAVSPERIATGRQMAARHGSTLAAIEARYGVPREIVLAVWGMESNFGANRGRMQIIPALATLAYDGRRSEMFQNQLIAAMKIIQAGDTDPQHMLGSWAGAMGHTQFMPTSYLSYAVDFTGDGRRDIWSDDPTDSLASTAAYLARNGWVRGQRWGTEVVLPAGFTAVGKGTRTSTRQLAAMGVRPINGGSLPEGTGSIIRPAGANGPSFLILDNFRAILRYNNADSYALGVSYLAEAIAGRPGVKASWPRSDRPLTQAERVEIQRLLTARGFYRDEIDGKIGTGTMEAISAFQRSIGAPPDGYATSILLGQLRGR